MLPFKHSVTVYAAGSKGDAAPIATIGGSRTCLDIPEAVAVDSEGNVYVASVGLACSSRSRKGRVTVYAPGSNGNISPIVNISGPKTELDGPAALALDSEGNLYVADQSGAVLVYSSGSRGNARPTRTIVGSKTGLFSPFGVALDSRGSIYVANYGSNGITIYSPRSHGNVRPSATIGDANTGLQSPGGIALDRKGNIYVANSDTITKYPPGSNAVTAPLATIGSSNSVLALTGIAVDSKGNIYVTNQLILIDCVGCRVQPKGHPTSVIVYSSGSKGNAKPIATISGLCCPTGIALDRKGNIYVANSYFLGTVPGAVNDITVYRAGSNGKVRPIAKIEGPDTGLDGPVGIALDPQANVYVANRGNNSVTVYSTGSDVDAKPIATIAGPHTGLHSPAGIALDSTGNIYVTNSNYSPFTTANSITVYAPGSSGDASPIAAISGGSSSLTEPVGVAIGP